jgi:hypothetical protein
MLRTTGIQIATECGQDCSHIVQSGFKWVQQLFRFCRLLAKVESCCNSSMGCSPVWAGTVTGCSAGTCLFPALSAAPVPALLAAFSLLFLALLRISPAFSAEDINISNVQQRDLYTLTFLRYVLGVIKEIGISRQADTLKKTSYSSGVAPVRITFQMGQMVT